MARWIACIALPLVIAACVVPICADDDLASLRRRIEQLEAETMALRTEAEWSRMQIERLPAIEEALEANDWYTMDELRSEMRSLVWTKGDFRIVPYGVLWGSAIYSTSRVNPGPYTLFVESEDLEGEDTFVIDTRRTRLGIDVGGPEIPFFDYAKSSGKVEIDFHGSFVVENKPGVLLRHAYGEVKNDDFRLLAGQTWDVISPLNPGVLNYSVGWAGGNIGYRRAQVRYERYLHLSDTALMTLQGSINQNIISDLNGVVGVQPEATNWPVVQGRAAWTLGERGPGCHPWTLGISGHIGSQGFDFVAPADPVEDDVRITTWSFNVDFRAPITERFGVQGEYFTGSNLGTFLGGIAQGVNLTTRDGIRASGGWLELWYDVNPRTHTHFGFGIDDPINADVTNGRTYNHFIFGNVVFDITQRMVVGFEISSWRTHYATRSPGDALTFEFMGQYTF